MTISSCPRCRELVRLPSSLKIADASADAQVRCPLCQDEYSLSEVLDALPPALIVLEPVAALEQSLGAGRDLTGSSGKAAAYWEEENEFDGVRSRHGVGTFEDDLDESDSRHRQETFEEDLDESDSRHRQETFEEDLDESDSRHRIGTFDAGGHESEDEDELDGAGSRRHSAAPAFQFESPPPAFKPVRSRSHSHRRRPEKRMTVELVKWVAGGVVGLSLGMLLLWWMFARDPFHLGPPISMYAPWIVPPAFHDSALLASRADANRQQPALGDGFGSEGETDPLQDSESGPHASSDFAQEANPPLAEGRREGLPSAVRENGEDSGEDSGSPAAEMAADLVRPRQTARKPESDGLLQEPSAIAGRQEDPAETAAGSTADTLPPSGYGLPVPPASELADVPELEVPPPLFAEIPEPQMSLDLLSDPVGGGFAGERMEIPYLQFPAPVVEVSGLWVPSAAELDERLAEAEHSQREWAEASSPDISQQRRLAVAFYKAVAGVGEALSGADQGDAAIASQHQRLDDLLEVIIHNPLQLDVIGKAVSGWMQTNRPHDGVVATGTVVQIQRLGSVYETLLELPRNGHVTVLSVRDPSEHLQPEAKVLVLGTLIDRPEERIRGYEGVAEQVILDGFHRQLP